MVYLAMLVTMVSPETMEIRVPLVLLEMLENLVYPDQQDLLVLTAKEAREVKLASVDNLGKQDNEDLTVKRVRKVQLESKAKSDHRDLKDQRDPLDQMERLVLLDQEEVPVNLELRVHLVCPENPDRLEKMARKVSLGILEFVEYQE